MNKKNNSNLKLLSLVRFLPFLFGMYFVSGCFTIKSEYPKIEYYLISQIPVENKFNEIIDASIRISDFEIPEMINSSQMKVIWDSSKIQSYYYHRWSGDFTNLLTEHLIQKFNKTGLFSKGVYSSGSNIKPDFMAEIKVLSLNIYSDTQDRSKYSYISSYFQFTLIKKENLKNDLILFTRNYLNQEFREDNRITNVAKTLSKLLNNFENDLIRDIIKYIPESFIINETK